MHGQITDGDELNLSGPLEHGSSAFAPAVSRTAPRWHMPCVRIGMRILREPHWARRSGICLLVVLGAVCEQISCGIAGSPSKGQPDVTVSVAPTNTSVFLGATQQFQSTVSGSSDTAVTWEVNNVVGGTAASGTISVSGLYTAPAVMPSPANITVMAVSQANARDIGSASVSLKDDIAILVAPNQATVPNGGAQVFAATMTASGSPATGLDWSVNGIATGNSIVGTIVSTGATTALYTAPAAPPSPSTVTVTATSAADSSKFGSASATITCSATNSISPSPASVGLGASQTFTASLCVPAGSSLAWDVSGIAGGNSVVGTITPSGASSAIYTAPTDLPGTNPLTIHAIVSPQPAGGPETASASVTITSGVTVSVMPPIATLGTGQRATFSANVGNASDANVTWSVAGVPDGDLTVGQICVHGSNPCVAPAGPGSGSVDYLAPAAVPSSNPVMLAATSHADPSKSGAAVITITGAGGPVAVTVTPPYAFLVPSSGSSSTIQFFAGVTGSGNAAVTWSVASAVIGQGCVGSACGTVDSGGMYSAPSAAPSPNAISVMATSQADPTKTGSATLAITSGPAIEIILPSSAMAGAVEGFPLLVEGVNFVAGNGAGASAILVNGAARSTTCSSASACAISLSPSDVQSAGTLTIQVRNPGNPVGLSNPVPFVIVPFNVSANTIALSAGQPIAAGNYIVVVEPTTAAASAPINVNFIGLLTGGNTCGAQGSPLAVTRPVSGTTVVSICVQGDGLDPTFTYAFSGPSGAPGGSDIGVTASAVAGIFPGMIELDLQISSTTLPGVRSLFITTLNNDRAAVTGMLEVQ